MTKDFRSSYQKLDLRGGTNHPQTTVNNDWGILTKPLLTGKLETQGILRNSARRGTEDTERHREFLPEVVFLADAEAVPEAKSDAQYASNRLHSVIEAG